MLIIIIKPIKLEKMSIHLIAGFVSKKRRKRKVKTSLLVTMLTMLLCQHILGGPTSSLLDDASIIGTNLFGTEVDAAIGPSFKSYTFANGEYIDN